MQLSTGRRRGDVTQRDALGGKTIVTVLPEQDIHHRSALNPFQPCNGSFSVPSGCVTPRFQLSLLVSCLLSGILTGGAKKRTRREEEDEEEEEAEVGRGFTDRLSASPALTAGQPWGLCWGPAPWLAV